MGSRDTSAMIQCRRRFSKLVDLHGTCIASSMAYELYDKILVAICERAGVEVPNPCELDCAGEVADLSKLEPPVQGSLIGKISRQEVGLLGELDEDIPDMIACVFFDDHPQITRKEKYYLLNPDCLVLEKKRRYSDEADAPKKLAKIWDERKFTDSEVAIAF